MSFFKHKGGSLTVWNADNSKSETLHYGEYLHKPCTDCGAQPLSLCTTKSGKPLGKVHKARH